MVTLVEAHENRHDPIRPAHASSNQQLLPYDATLLDRVLDQWQLGDWQGLTALKAENLEHHPDRSKVALLVAAAHLQSGETGTARQFVKLAQGWGCDRRLVAQVLVAGVYNTFGRIEMARGQCQKGLSHFKEAIATALPNADHALLGEARAICETARLGLLPQASSLMDEQLATMKSSRRVDSVRLTIIETELELLHHELSLAQQRRQLFLCRQEFSPSTVGYLGAEDWRKQLESHAVSQLGQDLWVLEKCSYKRNGFFVEFGATDGVLLSNTWLLEKHFGWIGICAEPNPKFFEQLKSNRNCKISNAYIGGKTGATVEFILSDAYGGSSEYAQDDQHADKRAAYKQSGHVQIFESISLDDFLETHGAPRDIDYISIDTEGSEYEILSTFPLDKWRVRLFTVEHNFTKRRKDIRQLLESHGYRCTERKWDDWYEFSMR